MKTNTSTLGGVIRHHCPLPDCGWFHDVDLAAEPLPPILLPTAAFDAAAFRVTDSAALSDAISVAAEKQHRELAERAETAVREHAEGHGVLEYVRALAVALSGSAKREGEQGKPSAAKAWPAISSYLDECHARIIELTKDQEQLCTAIDLARALHARDDSNPLGPWCGTCLTIWPCRTSAALDGTGETT